MQWSKLSILIVDDNINFVRRMESILNESGISCVIDTAHDYDQASLLLDKKPDLVLLDIQLPGRNGMVLLKRIKESAKTSEVIMLTNYTGEPYRDHCRKSGVMHFLDKTHDFELVPGLVKEFATKSNRRYSSSQETIHPAHH